MLKKILLAGAVVVFLAGCRRRVEPEVDPAALANEVWSSAGEFLMNGQTNEALRVFSEALENKDLAIYRNNMLTEILRLHLRAGEVEEAKARYLEVVDSDPELAASVLGVLEGEWLRKQEYEQLNEWCELLLARDLPGSAAENIFRYMFQALMPGDDMDPLLKAYARCVTALGPDRSPGVVRSSLDTMLRAGQHEKLDVALDFVDATFADNPGFQRLSVTIRFTSLLGRSLIGEAGVLLGEKMAMLPDGDAGRLLHRIIPPATGAGRTDLVEKLCEQGMEIGRADGGLFRTASRGWTLLARDAGDLELAQQRFSSVVARAPQVQHILRLAGDILYVILDGAGNEVKQAMMNDCDTLLKMARDDGSEMYVTWATMVMLDCCFMTESFDRAIELLETPIPGKDPEWQQMLQHKVKAHAALKAGNTEDAIAEFRGFMSIIATSEEALTDPSNNSAVQKETVLGLNAARIGDLWASIDEDEKAGKAYGEAREYYKAALEKAEADSDEKKQIDKSLADLEAKAGVPVIP